VHDLIDSLHAVVDTAADRDALAMAAGCRRALTGWLDWVDVVLARGFAEVAGYPEKALAEAMRIPVSEACPVCTVLHDLGTLVKDSRGKTMCRECVGKTEHARSEARSQGWDYDAKRPIPVKALPNAAMRCEHKWGMQLKGPTGAMELSRECILCGAPKD
jgi:hypothetical protein